MTLESDHLNKISPTEAGRNDTQKADSAPVNGDLIDALNQVFSLFRINFHNQYYKAFSDANLLNETKKLWLNSLNRFSASTILQAARYLMEQQEYLPTLNQMLVACEEATRDRKLPDAHSAYLEACRAPSPKSNYNWSHPLVYHAGAASDWFYLSTTSEAFAYAVFKRHYERLQKEMVAGKQFELPKLEDSSTKLEQKPINGKEASELAQKLLKSLEL